MLGPPVMIKGNSSAMSHAGGVSVGQKIVYVVSLAVAFCDITQVSWKSRENVDH